VIKGRDGGKAIVATGKSLDKPAEETPVLAREATISVGGGDLVQHRTEYVA
jgi:hypothetical protein